MGAFVVIDEHKHVVGRRGLLQVDIQDENGTQSAGVKGNSL